MSLVQDPERRVEAPEPSLLAFYRGTGTDRAGRRLVAIWAFSHLQLEATHDYIQWLFPLPTRSAFDPSAPVLDARTRAAFAAEPGLRERLLRSLDVMLAFYGLARDGERVAPRPDFEARARHWLVAGDHNHRRLTRIVRALRLLGCETEADALRACLITIAAERGATAVSPTTLAHWRAA